MQSCSQMVTANKMTTLFSTDRMPFLSPNQQRQSTEEKNAIHKMYLNNIQILKVSIFFTTVHMRQVHAMCSLL